MPADRRPRIAFLLGKPLRGVSVLSDVVDIVRGADATVAVHLAIGNAPLPASLFDADLVVQRGLLRPELAAARRLEQAGVRCCNRIGATRTVWDRALTIEKLAAASVPVPATESAAGWSEVRVQTAGRPAVVKAAKVRVGRGQEVLVSPTGGLPQLAPFAGPYIVQDHVRNDERDHKVYVAGRNARGLVKGRTGRPAGELGVPFVVDAELTELAHRAGSALGLEIYGVDFLYGPDGPVVVDVNPFPGFRGVPEAARLIADHVMAIADDSDET